MKAGGLGQLILLGRESLDRAIAQYVEHYHDERTHQGIGNEIVSGVEPRSDGIVDVRERLCGLLSYYYRRAA